VHGLLLRRLRTLIDRALFVTQRRSTLPVPSLGDGIRALERE
jgi:hypothetical protein